MPLPPGGYIGRFAPSPPGPLHAGSLVAALASWLDARAHHGQWLVRIEDIDPPRCSPGADLFLLQQLAACGLNPDQPPVWQSQRHTLYAGALQTLIQAHLAYAAPAPARESKPPCWPRACKGRGTNKPSTQAPAARAATDGLCAPGAWRWGGSPAPPGCTGKTGAWGPKPRTWPPRSATLCCNVPMGSGPTSSPWWWTTPPRG